MAVALRLSRQGNTHRPHYYIVAADSRSPRNGRFLEKSALTILLATTDHRRQRKSSEMDQ